MKNKMHFRAWLVDSSPEIWRELILDPRLTLEQLHLVMQVSFGWENCHMHQFHEEDGTRYGRPLPRKDAWGEELTDERKVQLSVAFPIPGKRIAYEYDFGDSWVHGIEFMG